MDQASVEFDEQEFLDPESFPRLLTFVASKLSGRTGPPLVKVTMNFNVGPSLAKVEMFDDFFADSGDALPHPRSSSFSISPDALFKAFISVCLLVVALDV